MFFENFSNSCLIISRRGSQKTSGFCSFFKIHFLICNNFQEKNASINLSVRNQPYQVYDQAVSQDSAQKDSEVRPTHFKLGAHSQAIAR